jgi:hypothetical protein
MVYAKAQELLSVGSLSVTGSSLVVTGTVGILVPEIASSFTIRSVGSPQVPFFSLDTDGIGIGFGGNPLDSYEFNKIRGGDLDRVLFLSGGGPTSPDIRSATDVNFFVSGSIGSKGLLQGTSVFGGDTVVSGALYIGDSTATTSRRLVTMGRAEITGSTYITGSTSLLGVGKVELSTDSSNASISLSVNNDDMPNRGEVSNSTVQHVNTVGTYALESILRTELNEGLSVIRAFDAGDKKTVFNVHQEQGGTIQVKLTN